MINSYTQFFDVPKGADDIRLVYNGTSCGLNSVLWAPNFWLPSVKTAVRFMDFNFYSIALDIGEMFLNFPLHTTKLQAVSGIDLTPYRNLLHLPAGASAHFRWVRTWMGAKPSPYAAVVFYYLAEEIIRGNHLDLNNPFYWDSIVLNLPGSAHFDPSRPRLMKLDSRFQRLAAELVTYIDDVRGMAPTCELAWLLSRRVVSVLQHLGIQDASRKRRPPTKTPGAWAGSVIHTSAESIIVTVTEEKWVKARTLIQNLIDQLHKDVDEQVSIFDYVNYKELEIARGFLVHLSMTYDIIIHHIKGFHLTLASYLPQRDSEGWKFTNNEWKQYLFDRAATGEIDQRELEVLPNQQQPKLKPPQKIKVLKHLKNDLLALQTFFALDKPPKIEVRKRNVCMILYGFADASGGGLGSTVLIPGSGVRYRIGVWGPDKDNASSNFREFENVVLTVEEEAKHDTLRGAVMYLFTDNSTIEAALHKGNSSSKKLFQLIVRLCKVQLEQGASVLVSHVSGKRMVAQGTDGISRGMINEGDGKPTSMLSFIPLHLSAIERSLVIKEWIQSWVGDDCEFLTPEQWFTRGHGIEGGHYGSNGLWSTKSKSGKFIWSPPPAAADVSLEELRKSIIKRKDSTHIIVIPRLLLPEWRRSLGKAADLVFQIDVGTSFWPKEIFGVYAPCRNAWCGGCYISSPTIEFHIKTREDFDSGEANEKDKERLLKAWGTKHRNTEDYKFARNGDHLLVPFQCDLCIFRKLTGRTPFDQSERDMLLLACIRRITLDAFWSRATSTFISNRDRIKSACALSDSLGLPNPYEFVGQMPINDDFGYTVAIQMIMASTKSGRYSSAYTQWDTIRKIRSVYSNFLRASPQANNELWALGDDKGKVQRFAHDPCSSFWFSRFFIGCKNRMGQDWRPNRAFSIELLLAFLEEVKDKIETSEEMEEENKWTAVGAYSVLTYVVSLRGSEGFLLDLGGLNRYVPKENDSYFLIPLLGKVKGESHDRCHLLPCTFKTSSGIYPYLWFDKLIKLKTKQGFKDGPAISDNRGLVLSTSFMNDSIQEILEHLYENNRSLFPKTITSKDDIPINYQAFRSFRRTSDTRAINKQIKADIIELVNRWHAVEKADGNRAAFNMRNHYAQYEDLINPFLTYTNAM